ncbi:MAG: TetR/AcrR family transcriptional regulator C-terminal domain-containing protein [Devosia sp.]
MAIEREKILDAALNLLNEVGLDQFTTRKLALRLGVAQPALYWHFRSKSTLLDALNEEMIARYHTHPVPTHGEQWDEFTLANARSIRRALLTVRDGARLNAGTRPTIRQFSDAEQWLRLYVDAGFTPQQALGISIGIARYVVGFVLEEQGERDRSDEETNETGDAVEELAAFPLLSAAIEPLFQDGGTINTEGVFEAGLGYMLAGIRASLAGKRKPRRRRAVDVAGQKTKTAP